MSGVNLATRCLGCSHYFITYDTHFPYGCQLLGFKSRRQPVQEVIEATGKGCEGYSPRPKPAASGKNGS